MNNTAAVYRLRKSGLLLAALSSSLFLSAMTMPAHGDAALGTVIVMIAGLLLLCVLLCVETPLAVRQRMRQGADWRSGRAWLFLVPPIVPMLCFGLLVLKDAAITPWHSEQETIEISFEHSAAK